MDPVMLDILLLLFYFTLLSWARYSQFKNDLRIPVMWMVPIVAALMLTGSLVWFFFGRPVGFPWDYFRFFISLFMFAISCFVIKVHFSKHALSYIVLFSYQLVLEGTAAFAAASIAPQISHLSNIILLVLLILTVFPLSRLLRLVTDKLSTISTDRVWNYLCLCGFSFLLMNLMLTFPMTAIDLRWVISRYLVVSGMIGMFAAAIWMERSLQKAAQTQSALDLVGKQVAMQQAYYDNLVAQMEEIRHIRHDLRHHRAALMAIVKSGDTAAAEEYVKSWDILDDPSPVTGNLVADSLVGYYYMRCKELGFALETELALSQQTPLAEADLCVLLGNLLENAVEAQSNLAPEDRFVRVCARSDASSFTLAVDNRFDGILQKKDDRYLTRKADKEHGIGLSSVRAVCKKYNGVLQLESQGDMFLAGIVIGL